LRDDRHTGVFVARELVAAVRARWFIGYSAAFLVGGLLLSAFGLGDVVVSGYRGFAKAMAGFLHLALLFVPLMALFPATAAIAEEAESGTLEYILSQPIGFGDVYVGKWVGVGLAMILSITLGFGVPASVALLRGMPARLVLVSFAFLLLLALAFVSLGTLLSSIAGSRARALTLGLLAWLILVAGGSIGIMAGFIKWGLPQGVLAAWSLLNPIEAFRLGVLTFLDPDLSMLGPLGVGMIDHFGHGGVVGLAAASLLFWIALPAAIGLWRFTYHPAGT